MTLLVLMLLYRFLWADACIRFSMQYPLPFIYPRTTCTHSHALLYHINISLGECEKRCQSVTRCRAINYNPKSRLCTLRDNTSSVESNIEEQLVAAPVECISLTVPAVNTTATVSKYELCAEHTCSETSMCVPLVDTSSYKCVKRFCPSPPVIAHASIVVTSAAMLRSRNAYVCEKGYTASSRTGIHCDSTGAWTPADFICHPNCPDIPSIGTAELVSWYPYRLFANTTAEYTCKPGHYNLTQPAVVCDEDGHWSEFECLPYCNQYQLPLLDNGFPAKGEKYTINMTAEYKCNDGFYLSPGSPLLHCDVTGAWSDLQVMCYKHCLDPVNPRGGVLLTLPEPPHVNWSTATFECDDLHYSYPFDTTRSVICKPDGTWSYLTECYRHCDALPQTPALCDQKSVTTNAPYTVNTYVTYEGRSYSHIDADGQDWKVCNRHGAWDRLVVCCLFCHSYSENECRFTFGCN